MGEIADALRRSGLNPTPRHRDPVPAPAPPERDPGRDRAREVHRRDSPAREENQLEELSPVDPAIVLEEGPNAEVCRQLAVRLRSRLEAARARSLAIVSGMPDEGKTTVLCDLGLALASLSTTREVAIVDLDLRDPSIAKVLNMDVGRGFEEALSDRATLDDVRVEVGRPALDIYPALAPQRSAHELLGLPRFGRLIAELEERYPIVLVDTPPALLVPDANLILHHVDVCMPIARAGQTRTRTFRHLVEALPKRQILTQLLNESRMHPNHGYYYYGEEGREKSPRRRRRLFGRSG